MANPKFIKTLRVRIKDKHAPRLRQAAREVNVVWNYTNETSTNAYVTSRRTLGKNELDALTTGSCYEFELIGSSTIQETVHQFVAKRGAAIKVAANRKTGKKKKDNKTGSDKPKRPKLPGKLRWRVSNPKSSRYSLGWIPFKARATFPKNDGVFFAGQVFEVFDSYRLPKGWKDGNGKNNGKPGHRTPNGIADYTFRAGSFSEDAQGHWYFCVQVEVEVEESAPEGTAVGIDLGMKHAATPMTGTVLVGREYRDLEDKLAIAQRASKPKRAAAIHAKIKNKRDDGIKKFAAWAGETFRTIVVGNVSSEAMISQGKGWAKSTLDAGWYMLKTRLASIASRRRGMFLVVDEAFTTQTCSSCKARSGPRGLEGLGIRGWTCTDCGAVHDRDRNSAWNILALGLGRLAGGTPA